MWACHPHTSVLGESEHTIVIILAALTQNNEGKRSHLWATDMLEGAISPSRLALVAIKRAKWHENNRSYYGRIPVPQGSSL